MAMSGSAERPHGSVWEHIERVLPVAEIVPHYDELASDLKAGTPVVLTDGGTRIAVIVAWDLWTLQRERYLRAAALSWEHWRSGRFDAAGFGWDVLRYLRPPMQEPLHPIVHPGEDGGPDERPS
jgi:antitoxin (DNA-binding transcriptional repressor) of toxin-antitoxin stability system